MVVFAGLDFFVVATRGLSSSVSESSSFSLSSTGIDFDLAGFTAAVFFPALFSLGFAAEFSDSVLGSFDGRSGLNAGVLRFEEG